MLIKGEEENVFLLHKFGYSLYSVSLDPHEKHI
jgi:hypothetical protein